MNHFHCCAHGQWQRTAPLGSADSIEVDLGVCSACGKSWAHLFVVANGRSLFEAVSSEFLESLQSQDGLRARKRFISDWLQSIG